MIAVRWGVNNMRSPFRLANVFLFHLSNPIQPKRPLNVLSCKSKILVSFYRCACTIKYVVMPSCKTFLCKCFHKNPPSHESLMFSSSLIGTIMTMPRKAQKTSNRPVDQRRLTLARRTRKMAPTEAAQVQVQPTEAAQLQRTPAHFLSMQKVYLHSGLQILSSFD